MCYFCWTWQGTLQPLQLILLVNIHLTTCEELSHNTSGQNDYLRANILGTSGFENMAIYKQQTKTLDLTLLILLFCYFVGLHSNNKYFNFSWVFRWLVIFFWTTRPSIWQKNCCLNDFLVTLDNQMIVN